MIKATLTAAMLTATAVAAHAQTSAPPEDVGPDLATEPLGNRSSHEGFGRAFTDTITAERIEGTGIYDGADERIGSIAELSVDETGQIESVIVDVGGVLGVGARQVTVPMRDIELVQAHEGDELRAYVEMSRAELEAMPESDL